MNVVTKTIELGDGRTITIETGKLAKQADGSVVVRMGNTMLLATVCAAADAVPGTDFMPLSVDYKEKYAAAGRFPGGFTRREGRSSDSEILVSRLVDRALRPLFPDDFHVTPFDWFRRKNQGNVVVIFAVVIFGCDIGRFGIGWINFAYFTYQIMICNPASGSPSNGIETAEISCFISRAKVSLVSSISVSCNNPSIRLTAV